MSIVADTFAKLEEANLDEHAISRATGADVRTVERWKAGSIKTPHRRHTEALLRLAAAVRYSMKYMDVDDAWIWLHSPNPFLDHKAPIDLLQTDYERVMKALDAEAEGVFA